jgi:general secretion pathway protein C
LSAYASDPYDAGHMNAAAWFNNWSVNERWRDFFLAHGPKIATGLLALLLGVQAASLVISLSGGGTTPPAPSQDTPPINATPAKRLNLAAITRGNLFGAQQGSTTDASNAPETSASLILTGLIAGDEPSTGLAILGESANGAQVYSVGDSVPGGVKLHAVYQDRVLLDRSGSIESLLLPNQNAAGLINTALLPTASNASATPIDSVRRLIAEQPSTVSEIMRPQAVFAQGKQRGYRVYPGRNRQAFVRLGLRPGDLITAINGTPLDDAARGQEIFQTLSSATEARVTVERNGRPEELSLNMTQIAEQANQLAEEASGMAPEPEETAPESAMEVPEMPQETMPIEE